MIGSPKRHGELLHRPRQRDPGRRQDRHGPAQRGRATRAFDAWIIAFAPADDPQYAIAVMLKGVDAEISGAPAGARRPDRQGDARPPDRARLPPCHARTSARPQVDERRDGRQGTRPAPASRRHEHHPAYVPNHAPDG